MGLFSRITISAKLALAYVLFLLPIGYLSYKMVSDKEANIAFAQKEIAGLHYITIVRDVQDRLVRGHDMAGLAEQVRANEIKRGRGLETAVAADALLKALSGKDRAAAATAAADLIGQAADGSNLTLDPDLDSFYTQDALAVRVPTAIAGVAGLQASLTVTAGRDVSLADRISIGVQAGAIQPALDALTGDLQKALQGNPDKTVDGVVTDSVVNVTQTAKTILPALSDHANAGNAQAIALPLLNALSAAGTANAGEVEHLLNARIRGFRWVELTDAGVALTLFFVAVFYVLRVVQHGTVKPLRYLTIIMRKLADHDTHVEIDDSNRRDEIGDMIRAVQVFKENMILSDNLAATERFDHEEKERRAAELNRLISKFEEAAGELTSMFVVASNELEATAHSMATSAEGTTEQTRLVADCAGSASLGAQSLASAAEELSASVAGLSQQTSMTAGASKAAAEAVRLTDRIVRTLAEAAETVGSVVKVVDDIASQTKLLALNATIEAARAGQAGTGFAVVANEVKVLAENTTVATADIGRHIERIQKTTQEAVAAIAHIGGVVDEVSGISASMAQGVEQQGAAIHRIADTIQAAVRDTDSVSSAAGHVSNAASGTVAVATSVLKAASNLNKGAETLVMTVYDFTSGVRSV